MSFEIVGPLRDIETFATGRELERLRRLYGKGRWRKRKALTTVRLADGSVLPAEVHWYEAAGIGKKEFKIKRFI